MFINDQGLSVDKILLSIDVREEVERYKDVLSYKINNSSFNYYKDYDIFKILKYGLPFLFMDLSRDREFLSILNKADYFREIFDSSLSVDGEFTIIDSLHGKVISVKPTFDYDVNCLIKEIGIKVYRFILNLDCILDVALTLSSMLILLCFFTFADMFGTGVYFTAQSEGVNCIC